MFASFLQKNYQNIILLSDIHYVCRIVTPAIACNGNIGPYGNCWHILCSMTGTKFHISLGHIFFFVFANLRVQNTDKHTEKKTTTFFSLGYAITLDHMAKFRNCNLETRQNTKILVN